jgi:hypothetical protein
MKRQIPWSRVLVEGVVIVVSILLAFGIEAGWESRGARIQEEQYLAQLLSDSRENRRRIIEALELEQAQDQATFVVLTALRGSAQIPVDSARVWIERRAGFYSDPRLLEGTMTALLEAGDLNVISSSQIRTGTLEYRTQIRSDQAEFGRWVGRGLEHADQFVIRAERALTPLIAPDEEHLVRALAAVGGDMEARAAWGGIFNAGKNRTIYLRRMLEATEEFILLLDQSGSESK